MRRLASRREEASGATQTFANILPRVTGEDSARKVRPGQIERKPVPSLIRFLILAGGLAAAIYGAMYALVATVQVQPREMTQIIEIPKAPK